MTIRQAVPKRDRDPADFVGENRFSKKRHSSVVSRAKGPKIPPPIEDAILIAVGERFGVSKYFDPLKPSDWSNTSWPKCLAAYLLYYMTDLDTQAIADLLGRSTSSVIKDRKWLEDWLEAPRNIGSRYHRDFAKKMTVETNEAMLRAEEISECAILWLDGVTIRA